MNLTYGTHTIDTATLPEASVNALISRGFSHFMGNETASRVASHFGDEIKTASDEAKATAKAQFQAEALAKLIAGTVGVSSPRGPRGTSLDTVIRNLAEKEIKATLDTLKLKMPSGDKVVEFSDGQKLTKGQLIERRLAKHGDRLRKEAEAEMRRLAKVAGGENAEGDLL